MDFRKHFPQVEFLKQKSQVYLDSAATSLKLQCVPDTLKQLYEQQVSNVHRGDHYLSTQLTTRYERVRDLVRKWISAAKVEEVIFTKSATEGINFLATCLGDSLKEGDEILLTQMEHHSNLLPWQALAKRRNLRLKFLPVDDVGELVLSELDNLVSDRTKIFSFVYYSNVLGTCNPVEKLVAWARKRGVLTVVDAAQAMTVEPVDVQKIGCDCLVFSGHKLFAPEGVGVLYAREEVMQNIQPYQLGGGMVSDVDELSAVWADVPHRFEAGTPAIGAVLALGAVLEFLNQNCSLEETKSKSTALLHYAETELKSIEGLRIIGRSSSRVNILSFIIDGLHCSDLGQLISQAGAAVRAGHHCCLPLMKRYGLPSGVVRASFSIYNNEEDIQLLVHAVRKAKNILDGA